MKEYREDDLEWVIEALTRDMNYQDYCLEARHQGRRAVSWEDYQAIWIQSRQEGWQENREKQRRGRVLAPVRAKVIANNKRRWRGRVPIA